MTVTPQNRKHRRRKAIALVSMVMLTGSSAAAAVGANLGLLKSSSNERVGLLSAGVRATTAPTSLPDTTTITAQVHYDDVVVADSSTTAASTVAPATHPQEVVTSFVPAHATSKPATTTEPATTTQSPATKPEHHDDGSRDD
jgi:hypothetical protein